MICKRKTTVKKIKDNIVISCTTKDVKEITSYTVEAIKVLDDGWEEVLIGYYNLRTSKEANSRYSEIISKIKKGELK